ncbi:MAG: hypothetical protein ACREE6_03845 [Limisphaerales bacterium]
MNFQNEFVHESQAPPLPRAGFGQAREPSAIDYVSTLRVGMTLPEADMLSRNYLPALDEIRNYPVACAEGHEYRCVFGRHAGEVMLKFNSSYRLVSWKGSSP